jgi:hypothetical protein
MIIFFTTTIISIVIFIFLNVLIWSSDSVGIGASISTISVVGIIILLLFLKKRELVQSFFESIGDLKHALILIVYIIFLVILFTILSSEYKDKYAYIILPFVLILGLVLFFNAFYIKIKDQSESFLSLVRLNYSLVFISLLIFVTILYVTNPGGYIKKFYWLDFTFTIVLCLMSIVYLVNVFRTKGTEALDNNRGGWKNIFMNYGAFGLSSIFLGFIVYLLVSFFMFFAGLSNTFIYESKSKNSTSTDKLFGVLVPVITIILLPLMYYFLFKENSEEYKLSPTYSTGVSVLLKKLSLGASFNMFTLISIAIICIVTLVIVPPIFTNDIINKKTIKNSSIFVFVILFFVFWITSFIKALFYNSTTSPDVAKKIIDNINNYNNILSFIFGIIIGVSVIALILYWFMAFYQNVMSTSTIGNAIIYFIVTAVIIYLTYNIVIKTAVYRENPLFQLVFNLIFYIPCLVVALLDRIIHNVPKVSFPKIGFSNDTTKNAGPGQAPAQSKPQQANANKKGSSVYAMMDSVSNAASSSYAKLKEGAMEPTPTSYYVILAISILLPAIYLAYPYLSTRFARQGGTLLINRPIEITQITSLASYEQLNNSNDKFTYQYGLSFWVYIDSASLSTNKSYETFATILDYGGKPKVSYNAALNRLRITMKLNKSDETIETTETTETTDGSENKFSKKDLDIDGNIIIYEKQDVLLQKWNNIIFNYSGGTLDIFYNGELSKSKIGVIPYMNYDNLIVGQENGIYGQICNVNYFKNSLNIFQINYIYKSVKDYSPPTFMTDDTIVNLNKGVGTGDVLGESTIMSDLPPPAEVDASQVSTETNDLGGLVHKNNDATDYLSLKWYFNQNGDNYN